MKYTDLQKKLGENYTVALRRNSQRCWRARLKKGSWNGGKVKG